MFDVAHRKRAVFLYTYTLLYTVKGAKRQSCPSAVSLGVGQGLLPSLFYHSIGYILNVDLQGTEQN